MVYDVDVIPYAISFGKVIVDGLLIGDCVYIPATELATFVFTCIVFCVVLLVFGEFLGSLVAWIIRLIRERWFSHG